MFDFGNLADAARTTLAVLVPLAVATMMIWMWKEERSGVASLFTPSERGRHHLGPQLTPDWKAGFRTTIDRLRGEAGRIAERAAHEAVKEQVRLAERDLEEATRRIESSVAHQWPQEWVAGAALQLAELRLHAAHSALTYHGAEASALGPSARLFNPVTLDHAGDIPSPYSIQSAVARNAAYRGEAAALGARAADAPALVEQLRLAHASLDEAAAWLTGEVLAYPLLMALADAADSLAHARLGLVRESLEAAAKGPAPAIRRRV